MITTVKAALAVTGSIGFPSKMPGTSYGIPAIACKVGAKLAKVAGSTCSGCYALKGNYTYPSVKTAQTRRLNGLDNPLWAQAPSLSLIIPKETKLWSHSNKRKRFARAGLN